MECALKFRVGPSRETDQKNELTNERLHMDSSEAVSRRLCDERRPTKTQLNIAALGMLCAQASAHHNHIHGEWENEKKKKKVKTQRNERKRILA